MVLRVPPARRSTAQLRAELRATSPRARSAAALGSALGSMMCTHGQKRRDGAKLCMFGWVIGNNDAPFCENRLSSDMFVHVII